MSGSSEISGFDYQSSWAGNCAQRSLIHSLLLLGIPLTENDAHRKTGVSIIRAVIRGTSLSSLTKAIQRCDCIPYVFKENDADIIRNKIDQFLKNGMPVIVSAEEGKHWAVLASKKSNDRYYWIDSDDGDLYGEYHWTEIKNWIENDSSYLIIGIRPKNEKYFNHSIVENFDEAYSSFDDAIAEYWGYYLDDLVNIFDSPTDSTSVLTAKGFFDKYRKSIIDNLYWQHGEVDKNDIRYELSNYQKVATVHKFTVSPSQEIDAVIGLTAALAYTI